LDYVGFGEKVQPDPHLGQSKTHLSARIRMVRLRQHGLQQSRHGIG
jgi:hypothetical protein